MRIIVSPFVIVLVTAAVTLTGCAQRDGQGPRANPERVQTIRIALAAGAPAVDDSVESSAAPTGYATLKGTFQFEGQVPPPTALSITKDQAICAPGGKTVYDENLVVNSANNGLANVLLYVDKLPAEWVHEDAKPGKTDEVVFDQKECVFLTRVVAMQTSQVLRVLNSDPVGHNLMVAEFNQTIPSGGSSAYQPRKEQRSAVEVRCAVHPWMKAYFINRDNGYFAVTNADGSFEIPNLPAGVELQFRVWQEHIGPITQVSLNGQPTSWSKGRMTLSLEPDVPTEINVVLSDALLK